MALIGPQDVPALMLDLIDRVSTLEQVGTITVGLVAYCAGAVPNGWLLLDGSVISATRYGQLVAYLGTTTLPNVSGRVIVGRNAATFATMLGTGGEETHLLTSGESGVPAHTHNLAGFTGAFNTGTAAPLLQLSAANWDNGQGYSIGYNVAANAAAAHNNVPPYIVMLPIIKH